MYFDLTPKIRKKDLYDFEGEFMELKKGTKVGRFILIIGPRRTGKTSLLLTFLNENKISRIFLDARKAMIDKRNFMISFGKSIYDFLKENEKMTKKLREAIKGIDGIEISASSVKISWKKGEMPNPIEILEEIDKWARENETKFIFAIDESQEMRKLKRFDFLYLFSYIYDHLRNIIICLTGSEVGVLHDFLKLDNPSSPLYGRPIYEIKLKRLNEERAKDFLRKGFRQARIKIDEKEIREAVEKLDGIIGWLTYYGWSVCNNKYGIKEVMEEASKLALKEIKNFIFNSRSPRRYKLIFGALSSNPLQWIKIKRYIEIQEEKEIDDSTFTNLLNNLIKFGFVKKENNLYSIIDPILQYALFKEKL